ncbi:MAG: hypothetical protein PWP66_341 [Thermosediminibacterales bacterium]|nr:hypothetical protein [Thermosediminibacterales bacterium]
MDFSNFTIAIVGPCASGKTTLAEFLNSKGFKAYSVAQEHSCVTKLWSKKDPDILIYLDVNIQAIKNRRNVQWGEERLIQQKKRLAKALEQCDIYIPTSNLSKEQVCIKAFEEVLSILKGEGR